MPIKKKIAKRNIKLTITFFTVFLIITSLYYYLAYRSKLSVISAALSLIKDSIQNGIYNTIKLNMSHISWLFTTQLILFVIAVISLILILWHIYQLYVIQLKNALLDPLIGIYNRRAIMHELRVELRRSERYNLPVSLAMIDIDFFKKYNDTLGHVAGDKLLKRFKNIFKKVVRDYDIFGRYGGEEFIIIFPRTKLRDASRICERLRKLIEKTKFYGESKLPDKKVTVSIGLAKFNGKGKTTKEILIDKADKNLYKAKEEGRNRVVK